MFYTFFIIFPLKEPISLPHPFHPFWSSRWPSWAFELQVPAGAFPDHWHLVHRGCRGPVMRDCLRCKGEGYDENCRMRGLWSGFCDLRPQIQFRERIISCFCMYINIQPSLREHLSNVDWCRIPKNFKRKLQLATWIECLKLLGNISLGCDLRCLNIVTRYKHLYYFWPQAVTHPAPTCLSSWRNASFWEAGAYGHQRRSATGAGAREKLWGSKEEVEKGERPQGSQAS